MAGKGKSSSASGRLWRVDLAADGERELGNLDVAIAERGKVDLQGFETEVEVSFGDGGKATSKRNPCGAHDHGQAGKIWGWRNKLKRQVQKEIE